MKLLSITSIGVDECRDSIAPHAASIITTRHAATKRSDNRVPLSIIPPDSEQVAALKSRFVEDCFASPRKCLCKELQTV